MKEKKLKSQKEIIRSVQNLKKKRKRVVVYNGSFDLLHLGHISALKEAKKQGDVLVVLVNSDESVKSYKGPNRPIVPGRERVRTLAAIECVDYLTTFDEINPKSILAKIKPDVYCSGSDWGKNCIERKVVEDNGGRVHVLKRLPGLSTTKLIGKILSVYSTPEVKAVFLDRDGTINVNEPEYVHKIEDFRFVPKAIPALQKLSKTNYKIIILTNQSGIGRGYFGKTELKKLHKWLLRELKKRKIRVDKIYHCPHNPKDNCSCRKPKIGMLLKAVKDFGVSLDKSWMIGDDERDVIMGREANVKTIKLGNKLGKELEIQPDFYATNILEAVKIIYGKQG